MDSPGPDRSAPCQWEMAYANFESPEQETRKFLRRLKRLGVHEYRRDAVVLELFCGCGSGLVAWKRLGFSRVLGADLSVSLLRACHGNAHRTAADARCLPFRTHSHDIVCVQGGLHHLDLEEGLDRTLSEIHRVLAPSGRFLLVEPWDTPYLRLVHAASRNPLPRKLWKRLDAFASMVRLERETYEPWLDAPEVISAKIARHFEAQTRNIARGKLFLVASPKSDRNDLDSSCTSSSPKEKTKS